MNDDSVSQPLNGLDLQSVTQPDSPHLSGASAAMVFRWRVHNGELLLRRRHIRELEGLGLPAPLMGWVHERLDWAVANMLSRDSDAVLVLDVDPATEVKLSLEEPRPAPALSATDLLVADGLVCGIKHDGEQLAGSVWAERDGQLLAGRTKLVTATETLVGDLASTLGMPLLLQPLAMGDDRAVGAAHLLHISWFLISDEFGFIPIEPYDASKSPLAEKIRQGLSRMW